MSGAVLICTCYLVSLVIGDGTLVNPKSIQTWDNKYGHPINISNVDEIQERDGPGRAASLERSASVLRRTRGSWAGWATGHAPLLAGILKGNAAAFLGEPPHAAPLILTIYLFPTVEKVKKKFSLCNSQFLGERLTNLKHHDFPIRPDSGQD